ncbi:Uncharacterised protein [Vibrio cholerae]|nr:Uncharacterised protein [Vibrio cholerae]
MPSDYKQLQTNQKYFKSLAVDWSANRCVTRRKVLSRKRHTRKHWERH